jgi:hypothetical protein
MGTELIQMAWENRDSVEVEPRLVSPIHMECITNKQTNKNQHI